MDFTPNIIRLPALTTDAGRLSTVFPRLTEGMVLSAIVIEADGADVVIRFRGMDVSARAEVPLQAGERVTLVVSELSERQVVFRLAPAGLPPDMVSLTDDDLAPMLARASLPVDHEGLAVVRALILNGKPLTSENILGLASAARAAGGFSPRALDAIVYLLDRGLPVTERSVGLAMTILAGVEHPAKALAALERLAPAPQASDAGASVSQGARAAPGAPQLPPPLAEAVRRLVELFPKLVVSARPPVTGNQPGGAPVTGPESGSAPVSERAAAPPASAPAAPAQGRAAETPSPPQTAGAEPRSAPGPEPQTAALTRQIASLVRDLGQSLESKLARGAPPREINADVRVALAELLRELEDAARSSPASGRRELEAARDAVRRLSQGLETGQMANSAPPRDDPSSFVQFLLPIRTEDGWEEGELRIYRRDPEGEIDPDNASVSISLNMSHLGRVDAGISTRGGAVACDFRCGGMDAARALERESASLVRGIELLGRRVRHVSHRVAPPEHMEPQVDRAIPG